MPEVNPVAEVQREVLKGLAGVVEEHLSLLLRVNDAWQPSDYLPDMTAADWEDQLRAFRAPAAGLSDEILVVLVGDMVTEEALPSYSVAFNSMSDDRNGVSQGSWAKWLRGWTAEENRHGDLLNAFLRYTGRVDMKMVERTVHHLLANGFEPCLNEDLYAGLVYTAFQERATKVSHQNVGRMAASEGNDKLAGICARIAGDEARHETFYTRMFGAVMDTDPAGGMMTCSTMLRRVIEMPGRTMTDGQDPNLFDHFSIVAQRTNVYTVQDYADILRHLVKVWGIAQRSVTGKAARAQEFLCRQADRIESMAEPMAERIASEPRRDFSWIYGRQA